MRIMNLIGLCIFLFADVAAADLHYSVLHGMPFSFQQDLKNVRNINKKAPADSLNELGATPLWVAAGLGDEDMVAQLIDHNADLEIKSDTLQTTPLVEACWRGSEKVAILLIERGANVNALGKGDDTALMGCAMKGLVGAVKLLLERGADANAQNEYGFNALMFVARDNYRQDTHEELFAMLLPATSNVYTKNGEGRTVVDYTHLAKLLVILAPRMKTDEIWLALEELKQYMAPSELEKFVNDLLEDAET